MAAGRNMWRRSERSAGARFFALLVAASITAVAVSAVADTDGDDESDDAVEEPAVKRPPEAKPRDEFGVKPDDGSDHELSLPDPVLDRKWVGPKPGEKVVVPKVEDDEDKLDPFREEHAPKQPAAAPADPLRMPPAPAAGGGEAKHEAGSPAAAHDPDDAFQPEEDEPSDVEPEEDEPSPLDKSDHDYDKEAADPGDE